MTNESESLKGYKESILAARNGYLKTMKELFESYAPRPTTSHPQTSNDLEEFLSVARRTFEAILETNLEGYYLETGKKDVGKFNEQAKSEATQVEDAWFAHLRSQGIRTSRMEKDVPETRASWDRRKSDTTEGAGVGL